MGPVCRALLSALLLVHVAVVSDPHPTDSADPQEPPAPAGPDVDAIRTAGEVVGLTFTQAELELMRKGVGEILSDVESLRAWSLDNAVAPALRFDPRVPGVTPDPWEPPQRPLVLPEVTRPDDLSELVYWDIPHLAALVKSHQVSCVELTQIHLARLREIDAVLHCVITYTEERALAQAAALDEELDTVGWRGMLHGIPWGAKDLLAVRGYRTTWGAKPFEDQVIDLDATVVERLDAAGAVLIAKLTLGALAWGDVWFGEKTRNPWNPEQGSSGSSAGSAAAVVAGGVAFAIGSETLGSIISPAERCGASALRPTFGRVSRHGAMALAWSMDKLGPVARSVDDAAIVFDAIIGPDGKDDSVVAMPWRRPGAVDVTGWRVGYVESEFEDERFAPVLDELAALGVELVPIELPGYPTGAMMITLTAESAAAFEELTRDGRDDQLVRQVDQAWPNRFRVSRLIPAVEYIQAQRLRTLLCRDMAAAMDGVVAYVHPSFAGDSLSITNLTGHPTVVAPRGFRDEGTPFGISFTGHLYDEARLLALSGAWQRSQAAHLRHPELP